MKSGLAAFFFVLMLIAVAFLPNPPPPLVLRFVFLFMDRALSPLLTEELDGITKPLVVDDKAIAASAGRVNFVMVDVSDLRSAKKKLQKAKSDK